MILSMSIATFTRLMFSAAISIGAAKSQKYDAIVIGAGAGGCVAAQSMVENGKKVLLIERGGEPTKSTKADVYTVLNKKANKCIETFDGDGVVLGTGNCLGGATTYNQGIWIEEQADFLNDYGGLFTTASVQSAFNYVTAVIKPAVTSQELNSSAKLYADRLIQELDTHPEFDIANITPGQVSLPNKGIWRPYNIFQSGTGERRSVDQILDRNNPNLQIMLNAEVTEIVFQTEISVPTARCVKYKNRNRLGTKKVCVKEMGRIFLAAGAIHTPELLMKSEIKAGGKVFNNDQVGKNLSDKPMGLIVHEFKVSFKFPSITVGEVAAFAKHTLKSGTDVNLLFEEITTSTGAEAMQMAIFEHAIADVGKRFIAPTLLSLRLLQYCLDNIERRSIICTPINNFIKKFPSTFTLTAQLATPKSTGEVRLGRNGKLEVSPGYLTNADDIEAIGFALRTAYNVTSGITGPSAPAKLLVPSFMLYSASLSDKEIGEKAKSVIISPHHFAGTASVGKVVDSNLKVIGVNGLYVADASALPRTTRVNSMASAMMIGRLAGINFT